METHRARVIEEIQDVIRRALDAGTSPKKRWIVHEVMSNHRDVHGSDAEWQTCRSYESLDNHVRLEVQKLKPGGDDKAQEDLFPGFDRLQRAYIVSRDGEQCVVRTEELTRAEWNTKIIEVERMGVGCFEHGAEMRRYRDERFGEEAAE